MSREAAMALELQQINNNHTKYNIMATKNATKKLPQKDTGK